MIHDLSLLREARRAALAVGAFLMMLSLSACLRHEVKLPDVDEYRQVDAAQVPGLKQQISLRSTLPNAFRASYQFEAQNRLEKQVFRQAVVFESPDHLRIDVFASSFQKLVSLVIATDGEFSALDAMKNILYRGASNRKNIGLLTHLPLNVQEYAAWALGIPFFTQGEKEPSEVLLLEKRGRSREFLAEERLEEGRKVKSFFMLPADQNPPRLQYLDFSSINSEGKEEHIKIQYNYEVESHSGQAEGTACPTEVPSVIKFSSPTLGIWGKLVCEKFEIAPDLSEIRERLFRIRVPDSTEVETRFLD